MGYKRASEIALQRQNGKLASDYHFNSIDIEVVRVQALRKNNRRRAILAEKRIKEGSKIIINKKLFGEVRFITSKGYILLSNWDTVDPLTLEKIKKLEIK